MELKEYLKIIQVNKNIFIVVVFLVMAGCFGYFYLKPVSYNSSLTLNITRSGTQESADYRYDDFYRLQADEKFAETVVQWLKSPRIVKDIYTEAGINTQDKSLRNFSNLLKPEKLSSQVVAVNFGSANPEISQKISKSITDVISKNIEILNQEQNEKQWFRISNGDPVIIKNDFNFWIVLIGSFLAGIFLAFWITLFWHYVK